MNRKTNAPSAAKMRTEPKLAAELRRRVVAKRRCTAAKRAQSFEGVPIQTAAFQPLVSGDFPHRNATAFAFKVE